MPYKRVQTGIAKRKKKKKPSDFLTGIDKTHNDFFLMWSERKSWRKDLLVTGKDRENEEMRRPNVPSWTRNRRQPGGTGSFEPLPQEGHRERSRSCCWFVETKEARREEQHTSLCYCVGGRREGWRNNLDGLGLIKEEKRQKKDKKGHTM